MLSLVSMSESRFPIGTPVCVKQTIEHRDKPVQIEVVGIVQGWEDMPTGSWFAHGKDDRLWLRRLRLRKHDGEETLLIIDDSTVIARIEAGTDG